MRELQRQMLAKLTRKLVSAGAGRHRTTAGIRSQVEILYARTELFVLDTNTKGRTDADYARSEQNLHPNRGWLPRKPHKSFLNQDQTDDQKTGTGRSACPVN